MITDIQPGTGIPVLSHVVLSPIAAAPACVPSYAYAYGLTAAQPMVVHLLPANCVCAAPPTIEWYPFGG